MKEIKHTPGPWSYDPETHEIESGFGLVATIANEGRGIAQDEEGLANANLIEAAPELLSACRYAVQFGDSEINGTIKKRLSGAIAKAEGRKRKV